MDGEDTWRTLHARGHYTFFREQCEAKPAELALFPDHDNLPADQNGEMNCLKIGPNLMMCFLYGFKSNIIIQPNPVNHANEMQIGWLVPLETLVPLVLPGILNQLQLEYQNQSDNAVDAFQMRGTNNYILGNVAQCVGFQVSNLKQIDQVHGHPYFALHNEVNVPNPP